MKKMLFAPILLLFYVGIASAQTVIKKAPGETSTLDWTYLVANESTITGFRVYAAPSASGTFTFTGTTAGASSRTVSFPTTFSANTVRVVFQLRAFKTAGTDTVESLPSPADKEVELSVPSPTALQVR